MKNNTIIAGAAVIIILAAVYFVFFQQGEKEDLTFSDGVKQINSLWEKNGVDSSYLTGNSSAEFSVSDLEALNDDLTLFQESLSDYKETKDTGALEDFTEIHLMLVDELVLALEVKNTKDALEAENISEVNLCANKTDLKSLGEKTIELNEKMRLVNKLIYAFNELHSGFEEKANLGAFIADETGFSETEYLNEVVLEELERLC